ncbi:MAG: type II toxin-antitoxin system RelE/ParE family toxin [Hyphomicrobiaceae bacterium]
MNVVLTPEALADLDRLRAFLVVRNPRAARRAVSALVQSIGSLEIFPDRGQPTRIADVRELIVPFGRSAYVIRYAHTTGSDQVVILRIWHGREERG